MRRITVVLMAVAAVLVAASAAFGCTNIATLTLSSTEAHAGETITVTGGSYTVNRAAPMPVVIHWNGADGREVARVLPDAKGEISTRFVVPNGQAGYYVVVSVQKDGKGADAYGTPSRASLKVLDGSSVPISVAVKAVSQTEKKQSDPPPFGALGGALLVGGVGTAVVVGRVRANRVPPPRPLS